MNKNGLVAMVVAVAVVVLAGLWLMQGGASTDPDVFSEAIFSTRRITIAPIVVLTGYGMMFYALLKRP